MDTEGILLLMMYLLYQEPVPFQVTSISGFKRKYFCQGQLPVYTLHIHV